MCFGGIETISHMFFYCPSYSDLREKYLGSILPEVRGHLDEQEIRYISSELAADKIEKVAKLIDCIIKHQSKQFNHVCSPE